MERQAFPSSRSPYVWLSWLNTHQQVSLLIGQSVQHRADLLPQEAKGSGKLNTARKSLDGESSPESSPVPQHRAPQSTTAPQ